MPVWMSLRDVVARAGSFDALRPLLEEGRIMARAEGFYTSEGNPWKRAPVDGRIPTNWWAQLCSVDPAANRATFRVVVFSFVGSGPYDKVQEFTDDVTAIGVELERAAAEAQWPAQPEVTPATTLVPRRRRGSKPSPVWEKIAPHFDEVVAHQGPFPSLGSARDSVRLWLKDPKLVHDRTIERWINQHRPWWVKGTI